MNPSKCIRNTYRLFAKTIPCLKYFLMLLCCVKILKNICNYLLKLNTNVTFDGVKKQKVEFRKL